MSTFKTFLVLGMALLAVGCKKTTPDDSTPIQPTQPKKQIPKDTIPEKPLLNEDKPSPHVSVAEDPKGHIKINTQAEEKHLYKVEESQKVVEVVPENKTGRETVWAKVYLKGFDDGDALEQVRNRILETSHNNNYKVVTEAQSSRKDLTFKIGSELPGPISLTQTLQNSLRDYDVRIEHRSDSEIVIQPK